jgi:hypothetical protein
MTIYTRTARDGVFLHNTYRDVIFHTKTKVRPTPEQYRLKAPLRNDTTFVTNDCTYETSEGYYNLVYLGKAKKVSRWEYEIGG